MSSDFKKILINDSRLDVTDQVTFGVLKGGQSVSCVPYNSISQSPSTITFNVAVPSEVTLIQSRVLFQSTYTIKVSTNNPVGTPVANCDTLQPGSYLVQMGLTDGLAPFPLSQSMSTQSATINNNTVSINTQDILTQLLKFNDKRDIVRYNGTTPTQTDVYYNYKDGLGANNNVLGGWNLVSDNDLSPRGAFTINWISSTPSSGGPVAPLVAGGAPPPVYINFTCTEPLLMSPFTFSTSENRAIYGVTNMNFVFNLNSGNTLFRSANLYNQSVSIVNVTGSKLLFNMLTAHPSQLLPSRCVVPFLDYQRYIFSSTTDISANGGTSTFSSSNLQLNQIPDKLVLAIRKPMGQRNCNDSDSFMCIDGVSISFNNNSGILSSADKTQLYNMSVENGSNQSWFEYNGLANVYQPGNNLAVPTATAGSCLVLQMCKDIQIVDDYYSCSSIGQFNLQINVNVRNQSSVTYQAGQLEMVIMTINSGVMALERGAASVYTAILNKADVIEASEQEPYTHSEYKRLVGGRGLLSTLASVGKKILPRLPGLAKKGLEMYGSENAKKGADMLSKMGYGMSGAGYSGAGYSGAGKLSNRYV